MKRVTKAIFPVAGLGTRFLPATKANLKEMMPSRFSRACLEVQMLANGMRDTVASPELTPVAA